MNSHGTNLRHDLGLNESPRPKAGKCVADSGVVVGFLASMKVPALRRGNPRIDVTPSNLSPLPQ